MTDSYRTITAPTSARITRKKSRFAAFLCPARSPEDIDRELARLRKAHHDAHHVCFAYRIHGDPVPSSAADDAGEPAGSAGVPILHRLENANLVDLLAVVVRHFGGVKLGVGGLVRAYGDAAQKALDEAQIVVRKIEVEVEIIFPTELTSPVMRAIHRCGATAGRIEYDAQARALVTLPPSRVDGFLGELRDATGARARAEVKA